MRADDHRQGSAEDRPPRWRNADTRKKIGYRRNDVLGGGRPDRLGDLLQIGHNRGFVPAHDIRHQAGNARAVGGVGQRSDRILDGVGGGRAGNTEGEASQSCAHHHLFPCLAVRAVRAGGFKPLSEQADRLQSEIIRHLVLADKDAGLCDTGNRFALYRGECFNRVGQCIRAGDGG